MKKLLDLLVCCLFCVTTTGYANNKFCGYTHQIQIINYSGFTLHFTDFYSSNDIIKGYFKNSSVILAMQQPCEEPVEGKGEFTVQGPSSDDYCYFAFKFDGDWNTLSVTKEFCKGKLALKGFSGGNGNIAFIIGSRN